MMKDRTVTQTTCDGDSQRTHISKTPDDEEDGESVNTDVNTDSDAHDGDPNEGNDSERRDSDVTYVTETELERYKRDCYISETCSDEGANGEPLNCDGVSDRTHVWRPLMMLRE